MTRFTASKQSAATVASPPEKVWEALTDTELLPRLTPYLQRIEAADDTWTWHVVKVPLLGRSIGSTFVEQMTFDEPHRIGYRPHPDAGEQQTEVTGEYHLEPRGTGTRLGIDIEVAVVLPFPRLARPAVEAGMATVMTGMGLAFSRNLLRHLGAMRILVLGASGYVGSRLVPALLDAGHEVVAASSSAPRPDRFAWGDRVDWARCDATDATQVERALKGVDGVCYLVHSLSRRSFESRDRVAAETVRDAAAAAGVRRIVYLSGLVPDVEPCDLSAHIRSRLEVEQVLLEADSAQLPVVALRAGVVIGAGSTSFEVIRQLATLLVVQPVPTWLEHKVQPIAVSDLLRSMVECFDEDTDPARGSLDVGGPRSLSYSRLLAECSRAAGLTRLRVPVVAVPPGVAGLGTAALVTAPFWTVTALIQSLRHDMVCRPDATWQPSDGEPLLGVGAALRRCFEPTGSVPEASLPSDEPWTSQRLPLSLHRLPAPASVRAGAGLAYQRARSVLGSLPLPLS